MADLTRIRIRKHPNKNGYLVFRDATPIGAVLTVGHNRYWIESDDSPIPLQYKDPRSAALEIIMRDRIPHIGSEIKITYEQSLYDLPPEIRQALRDYIEWTQPYVNVLSWRYTLVNDLTAGGSDWPGDLTILEPIRDQWGFGWIKHAIIPPLSEIWE